MIDYTNMRLNQVLDAFKYLVETSLHAPETIEDKLITYELDPRGILLRARPPKSEKSHIHIVTWDELLMAKTNPLPLALEHVRKLLGLDEESGS